MQRQIHNRHILFNGRILRVLNCCSSYGWRNMDAADVQDQQLH